MQHWIQSVKDRLKATSPKVEDKLYDYNPGKDFYKKLHESREREKKKREEWSKRFKSMNTNTGYLPGTITAKNTFSGSYITSSNTSIADSAIVVDGNANKVNINRPLIVNDRDVLKELDEMRDALLLLKRDVNMEEKYPRLKELKDEYERTLKKYQTFDAIKDSK